MRGAPLAILLLVAALFPANADAKWTQVRSANFLFVGDAVAVELLPDGYER